MTTMEHDDHAVGIRDLTSHTTAGLRRVSAGETITITVANDVRRSPRKPS